jgi:catechol 2,3-dioxygenase-like lactoylglutathione lyase family enzyme
MSTMMTLEGIDHVALAVADVERSAAWFIEVLGFRGLQNQIAHRASSIHPRAAVRGNVERRPGFCGWAARKFF